MVSSLFSLWTRVDKSVVVMDEMEQCSCYVFYISRNIPVHAPLKFREVMLLHCILPLILSDKRVLTVYWIEQVQTNNSWPCASLYCLFLLILFYLAACLPHLCLCTSHPLRLWNAIIFQCLCLAILRRSSSYTMKRLRRLSLHLHGGKVWQHLTLCKCFNYLHRKEKGQSFSSTSG